MPLGNSGRIVVELDPEIKSQLHSTLREQGTNLKEWFGQKAKEHLEASSKQTVLFSETNIEPGDYK